MAGALTERAFVAKMARAGFGDIAVHDRRSVGLDELAQYPLFTDELLELMRRLIPSARQREVGVAIVVSGRRVGDAIPAPRRTSDPGEPNGREPT